MMKKAHGTYKSYIVHTNMRQYSNMISRARYTTDVKMCIIYHDSMLFICRGYLDAALGGPRRQTGGWRCKLPLQRL